jgi:hypothetical protein
MIKSIVCAACGSPVKFDVTYDGCYYTASAECTQSTIDIPAHMNRDLASYGRGETITDALHSLSEQLHNSWMLPEEEL